MARIARHGIVVVLFAALLLPYSLEAVAAEIGYESHLVSFLIGPALYTFGDGLVPGLDYFSQYSVGLGYVFSFFLAPTAKLTLINYVGFIVGSMLLFYIGSCYFLRWFYGSWLWAIGVTLTIMLLQFHTDRTFWDPSSYVLRYPLLLVVVWLFSRFVDRQLSMRLGTALGVALGASLFLNTETGVYMAGAVTVGSLMIGGHVRQTTPRLFLIGGVALTMFWGLSLIAFGPRVLDLEYLWRAFEPLVVYGGGFNAWPIEWTGGWHYIYNIIAPGAALTTIGWAAATAQTGSHDAQRGHMAALLALSLLALLMSAKYVNQSIVAVWHVNAYASLALLAWWARQAIIGLADRLDGWATLIASSGLAFMALWLLMTASDARNQADYALRAYAHYPSLFNTAVSGAAGPVCPDLTCLGRVEQTDIDLITMRARPRDRVALVSAMDWVYLIEARRAPTFTFVPSTFTFTYEQLDDSIANIDLVFLPRGSAADFGIDPGPLRDALAPELREHFTKEAEGHDLVAWRRRSTASGL